MITVGSVIGSGIFLKPLEIAQSLPSAGWIHAAWIGLGAVCLFGAFAYAELAAMLPEAGGQYAFLRESWGRFVAFLYGWCFLLVINTGTLAGLAVAFADQIDTLWGALHGGGGGGAAGGAAATVATANGAVHNIDSGARLGIAMAMILVLAIVNHYGVGWGALLQNVSTFAKLAALAALVIGGFAAFGGSGASPAAAAADGGGGSGSGSGGIGVSKPLVTGLLAIFWAYEGWYQLPYSAAELKRPERDLPRGLVWGMLILVATYGLVNAAYLHVVPLQEMRTFEVKEAVPRSFVERVFGGGAANALTLAICISVFGAGNPNLLSSPRACYAMAQDGLLPRWLMKIHPVWQTPSAAIWMQAAWAAALVFCLQTFTDITEFVVFVSLAFYALTVASVYVLRRRRPGAARPYRCGAYPFGPAVFIVVVLTVDVVVLMSPANRDNALKGLLIVATGAPVYWLMRRGRRGAAGAT